MDDPFLMTFPVYSLLLKDGSGVVMLQGGPNRWLPLFTDRDSLHTYLERSGIGEVAVVDILTAKELIAFLENRPSRSGKPDCRTAIIDPITNQPGTRTLLAFDGIIASLKA
jgi:hypothetical protein